jgi:proton-translocating NAD(P)+ transhydrogenase subunit beta
VTPALAELLYLVASVLFIVGLKQLSGPRTAPRGNTMAGFGMLLATIVTLLIRPHDNLVWIAIAIASGSAVGGLLAQRIEMTAMPQLVALFNGFGGLASAVVAIGDVLHEPPGSVEGAVVAGLGVLIGGVTFTGSVVAFGKLQGVMNSAPVTYRLQKTSNALMLVAGVALCVLFARDVHSAWLLLPVLAVALVLGVTAVIPIGGADMPVVIALLNSYSGIAASATGYAIGSDILVIAGALVGASGVILTVLMCRAMNRSLAHVLFGAFGTGDGGGPAQAGGEQRTVRHYTPTDGAILLTSATSVVVVPGYGLAVARAQGVVKELCDLLEGRGITVKYGIHPVAGRMPGHMNVLLAEANVPYDQLVDMDEVNPEMENTDVVLVVGANDVVNPVARTDKGSPIYGMPIINADRAHNVIILKRSLGVGFAGIDNPLFFEDKTMMLFGDAKDTLQKLVTEVKTLGA